MPSPPRARALTRLRRAPSITDGSTSSSPRLQSTAARGVRAITALHRVGYEVEAVGCGTEAVPLLETTHFDLLLTDIVMPEMDGIELAQKASAIDPAIRVMFITGFAAVALQGGRTAPEAKLLSKPFHLKDLVMEVDRMFQTEDQHGRL